ncbi:metallophosphoesterase family protein [Clostridium lacusfryxellense]|uniref:metallophosphoesterase family protein n=1 Tax=Clostridium lacusfryxellense TaxID=205328 RepID=UPI001C0D1D24|nr:DNA repair exonuclease [Clostridium lacusfryxellense]MBU3110328.1 DNA repair exonuclease [Clostridium lacusfryxellense]
MSEIFRFIHASDLHLGSFLNVNGNPKEEIQELCKMAVYNSFERICNKAVYYNVDFILICGDVYDSYLRSVRGNRFFINQCLTLNENNINIYVIYGNHDALHDGQELFAMPPNVHILSSDKPEFFEVYKEGQVIAKIIGKSYKKRNEKEKIYEQYLLDNDVFNIAMLHTALEKDNKNYVPCTLNDLKEVPNIDYWALGHIHKLSILSNVKPIIAFAGIPQGRDMGEQGVGGVFLVTAQNKEIVDMEVLPIAAVVYKMLEIIVDDVDNIENYGDLIGVIVEAISSLTYDVPEDACGIKYSKKDMGNEFKGYILQVKVKGRMDLHKEISRMTEDDYKQFIESINEELSCNKHFMWIDSVIFRTTPLKQDFENLKMQNSIFEDLEEVIRTYTMDSEHIDQLVKNWGSIWKEQLYTENIDDDKFDFDEETIADIISQARELLIEKLSDVLDIT